MTPKKFGNPFYGVVDMITEMNRISDTMTSIENGQAGDRQRGFADAWSPPTDILARGNDLVIRCEVSGVLEEDVTVSLVHGVLTISGERKFTRERKENHFQSVETQYGSFSRSFGLPENVVAGKISAKYNNGILEVNIPKDEKKTLKTSIKVD